MSNKLISVSKLKKSFGGLKAVDVDELSFEEGELTSIIGPNGAGKTTLISIICGIVRPSSGQVTVDDFDIINDYRETRSRIGLGNTI